MNRRFVMAEKEGLDGASKLYGLAILNDGTELNFDGFPSDVDKVRAINPDDIKEIGEHDLGPEANWHIVYVGKADVTLYGTAAVQGFLKNGKSDVLVTGDRGSGRYEVKLTGPYQGEDREDDEIVYEAEITKCIDNTYNYKVGDKVHVIEGMYALEGSDIWGGIDPFIDTEE
jgi:hypothetical protein